MQNDELIINHIKNILAKIKMILITSYFNLITSNTHVSISSYNDCRATKIHYTQNKYLSL